MRRAMGPGRGRAGAGGAMVCVAHRWSLRDPN